MLYILLSSIILIPALCGIGKLSEHILGKFGDGISGKILLGILTSTFLLTILAFFFPLNIIIELIFLTTGLLASLYFKLYRQIFIFIRSNYLLFSVFLFLILIFGSGYPFILDHFGYYVPSIKFLTEIGLSKGISNLDLLLGQMSFWHIFQAGFSNFTDPFLRINSILLIVYLIYILEKKTFIHFLFFPVLLLFTQSPSPDLPAIVLSLIVLNEILTNNKNSKLLFAFSILIFAIKPTMIWVPIFCALYSILIRKSPIKFALPGLIILSLYILKNLFTFGYPVFPVSLIDLNLSWTPNIEILKISSEVAVQKTFDMKFSIAGIRNFSTADYIRNWFLLGGIKSVIHFAFAAVLLFFSFYTFKKNEKIIYVLWIAVLIKSFLVILFSAQYRFFIDVFFVVLFITLYKNLNKSVFISISVILSFAAFSLLSFPRIIQTYIPSFKLGYYMAGFSPNQWLKPAYFKLNNYKTHQIGNLKFNVSNNYPFNFDTPLPAISPTFLKQDFDAGIFPQKNTADLKDGFFWRKLTAAEKIKLQKILEDLNY